jgi:hypothetical protein
VPDAQPQPTPPRYKIILIQDPKILAALGIRKSTREIGINADIRASDVFTLCPLDTGGPNAQAAVLGCARHTYEHWNEFTQGFKAYPEMQECMHIAAELGRDAQGVHDEIVWYLRAIGGKWGV